MIGQRKESTTLDELATARAGLFAAAEYVEPPRDLRRAVHSLLAGLAIYAVIVLGIATFG